MTHVKPRNITFLLRAHGSFVGSVFNVPSQINLYNLSNTGLPFSGYKKAYDSLFSELKNSVEWPDAVEEIKNILREVYKGIDMDPGLINIKHIRGVDGDENRSVSQLAYKDALYRPDYLITTAPMLYEAPAGLIHIPDLSDLTIPTMYDEGTFLLSEIVQKVKSKYPNHEIHIICMFCRTVPTYLPSRGNMNERTVQSLDEISRMLSAEPETSRTPSAGKTAILDALSKISRTSIAYGDEIFYKLQRRGVEYGRGLMETVDEDGYVTVKDGKSTKIISISDVISADEWRYGTKQSGGGLFEPDTPVHAHPWSNALKRNMRGYRSPRRAPLGASPRRNRRQSPVQKRNGK